MTMTESRSRSSSTTDVSNELTSAGFAWPSPRSRRFADFAVCRKPNNGPCLDAQSRRIPDPGASGASSARCTWHGTVPAMIVHECWRDTTLSGPVRDPLEFEVALLRSAGTCGPARQADAQGRLTMSTTTLCFRRGETPALRGTVTKGRERAHLSFGNTARCRGAVRVFDAC